MFICRYLFIEVRQVIVVLKVKLLIRLKNNGRRTEEVLAQISISHKFHKFSGYPLATPEALKHWLLSPEAKSSSRNSKWVQRLPKCSNGRAHFVCMQETRVEDEAFVFFCPSLTSFMGNTLRCTLLFQAYANFQHLVLFVGVCVSFSTCCC